MAIKSRRTKDNLKIGHGHEETLAKLCSSYSLRVHLVLWEK